MFETKYIHQLFSWQPPAEADLHDFISSLYARYENFQRLTEEGFGSSGLIVLLLFFLFLVLIIIIYIKSTIDTFKAGQEEIENPEAEPNGLFYTLENPEIISANDNHLSPLPLNNQPTDTDEHPTENRNENEAKVEEDIDPAEAEERQKEKELSADLVRASERTADYFNLAQDYEALKQKMQLHAQAEHGKISAIQNSTATETQPENMIAVIINMLSRNVSEQKIAQAVYFHYKALHSAEDVIQIVRTIRDFIGLCNAGKFNYLPQRETLPSLQNALLQFASGDSSACLILLQALLNNLMEEAERESGIIKDLNYAMAANCACLLGNIARLNDMELAHNSFELATELSPKNVNAWNCLGDSYMAEDAKEKAMIAYQTVLDIADRIMYARQIAHAQQQLASYYLEQGLETKAAQYQQESSNFYNAYGINAALTSGETLVYKAIADESTVHLPQAIDTLLMSRA